MIVEPSKSFASEFLLYARQRLVPPKIVALAASVAACAVFASRGLQPEFAAPIAFILVWQFRLWDDLEDVAFDRMCHPDRVLVATAMRPTFVATVVASMVIVGVILMVFAGPSQTLWYAGLISALAAVYRLAKLAPARRFIRAHAVLVKYPVFVLVAAPHAVSERALLAGLLLYLALSLFEVLDDPVLRRMRVARALAVAEGIAIAGILVYGAIR